MNTSIFSRKVIKMTNGVPPSSLLTAYLARESSYNNGQSSSVQPQRPVNLPQTPPQSSLQAPVFQPQNQAGYVIQQNPLADTVQFNNPPSNNAVFEPETSDVSKPKEEKEKKKSRFPKISKKVIIIAGAAVAAAALSAVIFVVSRGRTNNTPLVRALDGFLDAANNLFC